MSIPIEHRLTIYLTLYCIYCMPEFWHPIVEKDPALTELQGRVFGCDDLWRHIKTFVFSPKVCWAAEAGCEDPCKGDMLVSYAEKHVFHHYRQGAIKKGIFTTKVYTCRKHIYKDGNPCSIS